MAVDGTPEAIRCLLENSVQGIPSELRLMLASLQARLDDISRGTARAQEALSRIYEEPGASGDLIELASTTVPRWHFAMLNDFERNHAFAAAIERRIRPGSHVLDIGSGTGLLAMMAADAGARRVTTCEANPLLAEIARQVIAEHGKSDIIKVIAKKSFDLVVGRDLAEPADLIISEIIDCGLVGEGLFPTIRHARSSLLAEDGELLPKTARIYGALLESHVVAGLNRVSTVGGYDVRRLNVTATRGHFPVRLDTWPHRILSNSTRIAAFDLREDSLADDHKMVPFRVTADGIIHAIVAWFEVDLDEKTTLCNAPHNVSSHWMQALVPLREPVPVVVGSTLAVDIHWQGGRLTARLSDGYIDPI